MGSCYSELLEIAFHKSTFKIPKQSSVRTSKTRNGIQQFGAVRGSAGVQGQFETRGSKGWTRFEVKL
jgi:hypothetical protein